MNCPMCDNVHTTDPNAITLADVMGGPDSPCAQKWWNEVLAGTNATG